MRTTLQPIVCMAVLRCVAAWPFTVETRSSSPPGVRSSMHPARQSMFMQKAAVAKAHAIAQKSAATIKAARTSAMTSAAAASMAAAAGAIAADDPIIDAALAARAPANSTFAPGTACGGHSVCPEAVIAIMRATFANSACSRFGADESAEQRHVKLPPSAVTLGNGKPAALAVVSPLLSSKFKDASLFLHTSLRGCAVEAVWVPVFSSGMELQHARAFGLLHEGDFFPTKVMPVVIADRGGALTGWPVFGKIATVKKYTGLRFIFCTTSVPYAIAVDDDIMFMARLTSEQLKSRLQFWSEKRTILALHAAFGHNSHDCDALRLPPSDVGAFKSKWENHYWWYADATIFERSDFESFWQLLKPLAQWNHWDHNMYLCYKLMVKGWTMSVINPVLPPNGWTMYQTRSYDRGTGYPAFGAGYALESATLEDQRAVEQAFRYRFSWAHAGALFDPKQLGGAKTLDLASRVDATPSEPFGRWLALHVDRFVFRAGNRSIVESGYRALHAMCTAAATPQRAIAELQDQQPSRQHALAAPALAPHWRSTLAELIRSSKYAQNSVIRTWPPSGWREGLVVEPARSAAPPKPWEATSSSSALGPRLRHTSARLVLSTPAPAERTVPARQLGVTINREGWVQRASDAFGQRWCDAKQYVHMANFPVYEKGKIVGQKWARDWVAVHVEPAHHYSLCWHEQVPFALHALTTATASEAATTGSFDRELHHLAKYGHVYAFGVAQGHNLALLHDILPTRKLLGFDSFKGLPEEDNSASRISVWKRGMFPARQSPSELIAGAGGSNTTKVFPGFFSESLTDELARSMKPAAFVDIDCDLHESTRAALDWLFRHRIARVGTIIGYDDFWTIPCHKAHKMGNARVSPMDVGEGLAHREIANKYGVRFECLAGPCRRPPTLTGCHQHNNWGPIFLVTAVGASAPHDGFEFSADEVASWKAGIRVCRTV